MSKYKGWKQILTGFNMIFINSFNEKRVNMKIFNYLTCFFVCFSFSQTEMEDYKYSIDLMLQNLNEKDISFDIKTLDKTSYRLHGVDENVSFVEIGRYNDAIVYYPFYKENINEIKEGEGVAKGGCLIVYLKNSEKYFLVNYFSGFYLARENKNIFKLDFNLSQKLISSGFVFFDKDFSLEFIVGMRTSYHMKMTDEQFEENTSYFSIIDCECPDNKVEFNGRFLYQSEKFEDIVKIIYQKKDSLSIKYCINKDIISEKTILPKWVMFQD